MISILKNNHKHFFAIVCLTVCFLGVPVSNVFAQESLTLSVTPTLFDMSATPGQFWKSSVKVVNVNDFPLTVYARAVNFAPQGESGQGKFIPVFETVTEGTTLAEWIDLDDESVTVPPHQSKIIPFFINVPDTAPPGGHFAAILVGTQPPDNSDSLVVKTSQVVSSLFFVRIEGDVVENGAIRTFSVVDTIVDEPYADFELRFENKGNVHLQPQGHITIFNMWGKERGMIPVNIQTNFGNVLPASTRNFKFTWEGESSLADIGRYKAIASLAYGVDARKFETHATYFWVIPIKATLITLCAFFVFAFFITWAIKRYVRRMLSLAGLNPDRINDPREDKNRIKHVTYKGDIDIGLKTSMSAPLRFGFDDLKSRLQGVSKIVDILKALGSFVSLYRVFFISLVLFVFGCVSLVVYFKAVTVEERDYEISVTNADQNIELNSEEISFEALLTEKGIFMATDVTQPFELSVINTSGKSLQGAQTSIQLVEAGYSVAALSFDSSRTDGKSVVIYDISLEKEALQLSKLLNGALLSARATTTKVSSAAITIYVGKDQIDE